MMRSVLAALTLVPASALAQGEPPRPPRPAPDPAAFVDRMMQGDSNGDGKLTEDELPRGFGRRILESADRNGDGALDREELLAFAAQRRNAPPPPPPQAQPEEESPASLHALMEDAGRALRRLRRLSLDQNTPEDFLPLIQTIQRTLVLAKTLPPTGDEMAPQAREKYGDDLVAYKRDFRIALLKALRASIDFELAVLQNQPDQAGEHLQRLIETQRAAHDAFQPPDDH